jgi:site-specific recombinase XerD
MSLMPDNGKLSGRHGSSDSNLSAALYTTGSHIPSGLQKLVDTARAYADASKSPNTRRAYKSDWKAFTGWCRTWGFEALPARPEVVAMFVSHLAGSGKKVSSISRMLVSISQAHKFAGLDSPTSAQTVRETVKGIKRSLGTAQRQKAPLMAEQLRVLVQLIPDGLLGARNKALLLLGFSMAARRTELVAVDVEDLAFTSEGLIVNIRKSKTDPEGKGRQVGVPYGSSAVSCPVRAVKSWMEAACITTGPIFRGVGRWGNPEPRRLNDRAVARIVQQYTALIGLNSGDFAGHSLRSGLASSAAKAGRSERSIMDQTGHKSLNMVRRYVRLGNLFTSNAAAGLL